MANNEIDELILMAQNIRVIFLNALHETIKTDTTNGSCAFACFLAKNMLDKFTSFQTSYRGGDGHGDGGYIDSAGKSHGHYWLEVKTPSNVYIFDITADQFGDEPIILLPFNQAKQYVAGCQKIVDEHFLDF